MAVYAGPEIVTNGLVLALDAGNTQSYPGSGTAWTDLSGNGNNGTLTNGPTFSSGDRGSIVFDGTNDNIALSPGSNFAYGTGDFAVEIWFNNTSALPATGAMLYTQSISGTNYFIASLDAVSLKAGFGFALSGGGTFAFSSQTITQNVWYHYLATRIGTSLTLYLNNISSTPITCAQNFTDTTYPIRIAAYGHSNANCFPGRIAILKIYKGKGFTATEVAQNFNALRGRFGI